ncbi:DUF3597 domain-containing protein [Sphingomonas lutea]|uniref:DUF3597 domain-containing protein n=1 Tax=Sphingomonas lutea TaxID=1045317 RepID=A0A7G9SF50_9SPHN|nr:DUF3597 domain-containing protein [Sphingomonas lutea]QNN66475.1 DUF3597 domain-containing protein [Sphingomonas lutea]
MSIFSKIKDAIFGRKAEARPAPQPVPQSTDATTSAPTAPTFNPTPETVDVGAVLANLAQAKGGGGNYKTSIVDLLKLLDLDSSLAERKELAAELNVNAGDPGSAEQNIALHRAVMQKLAENGGIVPADMRD